jgi:spermidine synthase
MVATLRYVERTLPLFAARLVPLLAIMAGFFSGAAALTLEVVWSKALVVPLGNSNDATSLVLAGFMLGIALGALLGAKLAQRQEQTLVRYALLELVLAAFAVFVPGVIARLTLWRMPVGVLSLPAAAFGVRLAVAFWLITLPCLVMGATLPLLLATPVRALQRRSAIGALYGINTLGATLASVATGFYGIAHLGITGSSNAAAGCSLIAAALALLAGWLKQHGPERSDTGCAQHDSSWVSAPVSESSAPGAPSTARTRQLALVTTFVCGFVLLAAEVFWARVLVFVFGHDTYAFATLLATVLVGLALGGLLYPAFAHHHPRRVLGWTLGLMGVTLLASFCAAAWLIIKRGRDPFTLGDRFVDAGGLSIEMLREFAFTPVLVLVPCVLSGLAYPATVALYAGERCSTSRAVGHVGMANGIGATCGAALAASGWLGWFGIQGVLTTLALLSGALGALWFGAAPKASRFRRLASAVPLLVVGLGAMGLPRDIPRRMLMHVLGARHQRLLHYEEARTASVAVIQNQIHGERQLLVNAVNEVTTRLVHDQSFKLLGQLGPLLHPDPQSSVMICLGAGLAAGSALTSASLRQLEVVDLLEAVRRGAAFFPEENNHVLDDRRLKLRVNDGRQFLLVTERSYDLAIIDSTHPKSVDSWILYTQEFFRLVKRRLQPGGIVVQWLPLHGLSEREFRSVVATFASVFPRMTLWASVGYETYGQVGYAKLVGQRGTNDADAEMRFDVRRIAERLRSPAVHADLARYGMDTLPEILDQFIAGPERIREWTRVSPILTDDRPFLGYFTALSSGAAMTPDRLLTVREPVRPFLEGSEALASDTNAEIDRAFDAQGLVIAGQLQRAAEFYPSGKKIRAYVAQTQTTLPYYSALAERYGDDPERLFEAGTQLGALGYPEQAQKLLDQGLRLRPGSLRLRLNHGLIALGAGDARGAATVFSQLLVQHPSAAILHHNLGVALLEQGEPGAARHAFNLALESDAQAANTQLALADAELQLGALEPAKARLEALARQEPFFDAAIARLAQVTERLGEPAKALTQFERAARLNPYAEALTVEWCKRLSIENPRRAFDWLARAEALFPNSVPLRLQMGETLLRLTRWQDAAQQFLVALEQDPSSGEAALGLSRSLVALNQRHEAAAALCLAETLGVEHARVALEQAKLGNDVTHCPTRP